MSLERLKKLTEKLTLSSKVLYIVTFILMICQTISFLWISLMPNKLNAFFNIFRIWAPFVSDINNIPLSRLELSLALIKCIFLFLILLNIHEIFKKLSVRLDSADIIRELKCLSLIFLSESIVLPILRAIVWTIYLKTSHPLGLLDFTPLAVSLVLYYIAIFIQSKSVEK